MLPILFTIPKVKVGSFALGPMPIHSYGVMLIIGFLAGMWLIKVRSKSYGFVPEKILDMGFWALIAGVLGARVSFIIQELPHYLHHLNELFSLQFSGLTSFGGEILGFVAIVVWARRQKYSVASILDLSAPAFLLGYAIGRVGCFLNGCCFGSVCSPSLPWATKFEDAVGYHHPAQLYDTLMSLAAMGLLLWIEKKKLAPGKLVAIMLMLHGLTRFIYEFWRAGTEQQVEARLASSTYWGNLPITQGHAMALVLIFIGAIWYFFAARRKTSVNQPDATEMHTA